jgi:hypothetical protein
MNEELSEIIKTMSEQIDQKLDQQPKPTMRRRIWAAVIAVLSIVPMVGMWIVGGWLAKPVCFSFPHGLMGVIFLALQSIWDCAGRFGS